MPFSACVTLRLWHTTMARGDLRFPALVGLVTDARCVRCRSRRESAVSCNCARVACGRVFLFAFYTLCRLWSRVFCVLWAVVLFGFCFFSALRPVREAKKCEKQQLCAYTIHVRAHAPRRNDTSYTTCRTSAPAHREQEQCAVPRRPHAYNTPDARCAQRCCCGLLGITSSLQRHIPRT